MNAPSCLLFFLAQRIAEPRKQERHHTEKLRVGPATFSSWSPTLQALRPPNDMGKSAPSRREPASKAQIDEVVPSNGDPLHEQGGEESADGDGAGADRPAPISVAATIEELRAQLERLYA